MLRHAVLALRYRQGRADNQKRIEHVEHIGMAAQSWGQQRKTVFKGAKVDMQHELTISHSSFSANKLPMDAGRASRQFPCSDSFCKLFKLPMDSGRQASWLPGSPSSSKAVRFPTPRGSSLRQLPASDSTRRFDSLQMLSGKDRRRLPTSQLQLPKHSPVKDCHQVAALPRAGSRNKAKVCTLGSPPPGTS